MSELSRAIELDSSMAISTCVFCDVTKINGQIEYVGANGYSVRVFEPLSPVTPGHTLVAPVLHVEDVKTDPLVSAATMQVAAMIARRFESVNVITSAGAPATQTVFHLHVHVVPRTEDDGLKLPWTGQH